MKSARYNARKATLLLKREEVSRPSRARQQPAKLPTSLKELREKLGDNDARAGDDDEAA